MNTFKQKIILNGLSDFDISKLIFISNFQNRQWCECFVFYTHKGIVFNVKILLQNSQEWTIEQTIEKIKNNITHEIKNIDKILFTTIIQTDHTNKQNLSELLYFLVLHHLSNFQDIYNSDIRHTKIYIQDHDVSETVEHYTNLKHTPIEIFEKSLIDFKYDTTTFIKKTSWENTPVLSKF